MGWKAYSFPAKDILQKHWPRPVLVDNLEPVVGVSLTHTRVRGHPRPLVVLAGVTLEVADLVRGVPHDSLLNLLHRFGDELGGH